MSKLEFRPLRIAQISVLDQSVPPKKYAGIERIVSYLTEELVRRSHQVTLFASSDSITSAQLISKWPSLDNNPVPDNDVPYNWMMETIQKMADQFDVLHFHTDLHFEKVNEIFAQRKSALVITLHGLTSWSPLLGSRFSNLPLVSISMDQRTHGNGNYNFIGNAYHGIPKEHFKFVDKPTGNYFAFLGRIAHVKGPDMAIQIAVKAKVPLKIAAKIDAKSKYWLNYIKPLIDEHKDLVEFVGEIDEEEKRVFLANALGLIFPIKWNEPFGLVLIESMACGTPVIARRKGSVPEIIEDGISGYLFDNLDQAVEATKRIKQIDRSSVRNAFEQKFTAVRMTNDYEKIYNEMFAQQNIIPGIIESKEEMLKNGTLERSGLFEKCWPERKVAMITGITGQDGSYLAELLLSKGYHVHGIVRRCSAAAANTGRIEHLLLNPNHSDDNGSFHLHYGDMTDSSGLAKLISTIQPKEVYNLAAQSDVKISFELPEYTAQVNALGTLRLLEAIYTCGFVQKIRFYQASSSEMFGNVHETPQKEITPFCPRSPYAIAKLYSYWTIRNYREAYQMFASNGILFNHESPRRVARIALGQQKCIELGNLNARRDWGHARDYVEAMWMILQHNSADDFVISTGKSHTVREFVTLAFKEIGQSIVWEGEGPHEIGREKSTDILRVKVNSKFYRPSEVDELIGDSRKAYEKLGWCSKITIEQLVHEMVSSDIELMKTTRPIVGGI